jgi:hypothetical protein
VKLLDNLLHIVELLRELLRPGGRDEWRRVDPRENRRRLKLPTPKGDSCYPHHPQLTRDQLIDEDEIW